LAPRPGSGFGERLRPIVTALFVSEFTRAQSQMGKKNANKKGGPRTADVGSRSGKASGGMSPLLLAPLVLVAGVAAWYLGSADTDEAPGHRSLADDTASHGGPELECGPAGMEHLSDLPAFGLHVLSATGDGAFCADGASSASVSVHIDGSATDGEPPTLEVACKHHDAIGGWLLTALKGLVTAQRPALLNRLQDSGALTSHAMHELSGRPGLNRWNFFTPYGTPVAQQPAAVARALAECGVVYVYEGGNFVWPGIRIGHNITLQTGDEKFGEVTLTTLSLQPRVFTIDPLLTEKECNWIIKKAEPEMIESPVSHIDSDVGKASSEWRTSTQTRLPKGGGKVISRIEERAHRIIRVPELQGEPLQVLRYLPGQKYDAHHDYFDPELYKGQPEMLKMVEGGERNRLATLLWYMAAPEEGGETHFPRAGGLSIPPNFKCGKEQGGSSTGLKVLPKQGLATLFYSLRPDGAPDPFSLHGGCPPENDGVKWAVNKWVWSKTY
jgi:hypothetical protein